ncbi:hypothetical protein BCL64_11556 [Halomonas ventosae]|uniref:Uncharacterized protein n=2 Tax=Halomonas ventosae TaxID=229007 RepID=A0A2T0VF82_9GAMM|nr:hypothetical protein BCL64_11556 [Halomonas ventosae]
MAAEYAAASAWATEFRGSVTPSSAANTIHAVDGFDDTDSPDFPHLASYYAYYSKGSGSGLGPYQAIGIGEVSQVPPVYRFVEFTAVLALGPGAPLVAASEAGESPEECLARFVYDPPSSNMTIVGEEEVFGNLKAAMQVGCPEASQALIEAVIKGNSNKGVEYDDYANQVPGEDILVCETSVNNNRFCNYQGGIQSSIDMEIFSNPALMAEYIDSLRTAIRNGASNASIVHDLPGSLSEGQITFVTPIKSDVSNAADVDGDGLWDKSGDAWVGYDGITPVFPTGKPEDYADVMGKFDDAGVAVSDEESFSAGSSSYIKSPRVTYSHSGNFGVVDSDGDGVDGGVLIIDGNLELIGVPSFDGLVIVLGDYQVTGGGGGEFNGSVVTAPIVGVEDAPQVGRMFGNALTCYQSDPDTCGFDKKKKVEDRGHRWWWFCQLQLRSGQATQRGLIDRGHRWWWFCQLQLRSGQATQRAHKDRGHRWWWFCQLQLRSGQATQRGLIAGRYGGSGV